MHEHLPSRVGGELLDQRDELPARAVAVTGARDVVDGLPDGGDALGILVGDLDPELVFELHDQLDEIERVSVEILLEGRRFRDVGLLDTELLHQNHLHSLEYFLARSCHVTSLSRRNLRGRDANTVLRPPQAQVGRRASYDAVLDAARCKPDRVRDRTPRGVAVRDDDEPRRPSR